MVIFDEISSWIEKFILKDLNRPDDYKVERWEFFKKFMWCVVYVATAIVIAAIIMTKMFPAYDMPITIGMNCLWVICLYFGFIKKPSDKNKDLRRRWWRGEISKWKIFKIM